MGHGPRTLKRSRRSLGLPPFVVAALRRRQEFQAWERAAAGANRSDQWEAETTLTRADALVRGWAVRDSNPRPLAPQWLPSNRGRGDGIREQS
jgi:hypothetical protein